MKKWMITLSMLLAIVLVVSACGNAEKDTGNTSNSGETKEFTINASNFEFDLKEIKVNKGDTIKINLENTEGYHEVKFEGYNKEVQGSKTISFKADKAGEFDYVCSIFCGAGHDDMVGKLIVQ